MRHSNYPPGVTGREPEIAGYPDEYEEYLAYCEKTGEEPLSFEEAVQREDEYAQELNEHLKEER